MAFPKALNKRGVPGNQVNRKTEPGDDMFGCDEGILQVIGDIDEPIWSDDDFDMISRPHQNLG